MDERKSKTRSTRGIGDHYVWPEFEKELYSICPQRRCTLQSNGQTKNMSENYLMRKQFSQNSRKRKDKRVQENHILCNSVDFRPDDKGKKSKQKRRIAQFTPTWNSNNNSPFETLAEENEIPTGRLLQFDPTLDDVTRNQKSDSGGTLVGNKFSTERNPKRPKLDENLLRNQNDVDKSEMSWKEQFPAGQLIWGKLKGFDWWPGIVVELNSLSQMDNQVDEVWVKWYGDNKFSKLLKNEVVLFRNFGSKYQHSKWKGVYKRAVLSAIEVAVARSNHQFPNTVDDSDKPSRDDREKMLLNWALDDFKPGGPEAFESIKDEHKVTVNPSAVSLEETWNRQEGKDRFGQPIKTPALAEDVKVVFDQAVSEIISIEDICLGCGDIKINVRHPLFHGSLCEECKETFLECVYLFDEDGYQMYCTICGDGKEVFMCESPGCFRSYCAVCLELLCGAGTVDKISSLEKWSCIMCLDVKVGLLEKREDWQEQLRELFASDKEQEYTPPKISAPVPPEKRKPLRVLSLFDGIATGLVALKELGLDVEVYVASEIDENATRVVKVHHGENNIVQFVGDIEQITGEQIETWGPFDLVIGASPCNDLSIANPARQGIYGRWS